MSNSFNCKKMRKELHYKKTDAEKAANAFAAKCAGTVETRSRYGLRLSADDRTRFDYEDDEMLDMCWSGEVAGIAVTDAEGWQVGLFCYWDLS